MTFHFRFAIIVGDLIQTLHIQNAEKRMEEINMLKSQIDKFHDKSIPLLLIAGNHDIGYAPSDNDVKIYEKEFGNAYYSFETLGVRFLCLETSIFVEGSTAHQTIEDQYKWLELKVSEFESLPENDERRHQPLIVFTHHPLFIDAADEGEDIGNVELDVGGKIMTLPQSYFHVQKLHRKRIMQLIKSFAGEKNPHIFSGHMHLNHGVEDAGFTQIITTSCTFQLGKGSKDAFRIVHVEQGGHVIKHKTIQVSLDANENGLEGEWDIGGHSTGEELDRFFNEE